MAVGVVGAVESEVGRWRGWLLVWSWERLEKLVPPKNIPWEPPFEAVANTPPSMDTRFADPNAQSLHFEQQLVHQMRSTSIKTQLKLIYKPPAGIFLPSRYA